MRIREITPELSAVNHNGADWLIARDDKGLWKAYPKGYACPITPPRRTKWGAIEQLHLATRSPA